MLKLTQEQARRIVQHVAQASQAYKDQMAIWKQRMTRVYKEVSTFDRLRTREWDTTFKVNKAHEIENKTLPRIIGKSPKWLVSYKSDDYIDKPWFDTGLYTKAIGDYLHRIFDKQDMVEMNRLRAKAMIRYWVWRVDIWFKYPISRTTGKKEVEEMDEYGQATISVVKDVKENVDDQYPCINVVSRRDILFDPRYLRFEDMPAIIKVAKNVRLSYFTQHKDKFINVNDLVKICIAGQNGTQDEYTQIVQQIAWVTPITSSMMKPDTLELKRYCGYFDLSEKQDYSEEKLYEFWTVWDTLVTYAEEISQIPYEDTRCFEDTEAYFPSGMLEPILWLQEEMNFKKNAASVRINQTLYPSRIRSPMSWIDPRKTQVWPWGIITTTKDWETAMKNFQELPYQQMPYQYFTEQQDFERQIQSATFTIDAAQPVWLDGWTRTATEAKINSFGTNAVMDEIRKHFEESMERLAYKLLQVTFDNSLEENIIIKQLDGEWFWVMHKEALRDAVNKYEIKVEAWSSSADSEETRREDRMARWNIGVQAVQAGLQVNLKKLYEDVMTTFDGVDKNKLFQPDLSMLWMQQPWAPEWGWGGTALKNMWQLKL